MPAVKGDSALAKQGFALFHRFFDRLFLDLQPLHFPSDRFQIGIGAFKIASLLFEIAFDLAQSLKNRSFLPLDLREPLALPFDLVLETFEILLGGRAESQLRDQQ